MKGQSQQVTIIYYDEKSLELMHHVAFFDKDEAGRVVIPPTFKKGKSILAVCTGEIEILNKIGDRILPIEND